MIELIAGILLGAIPTWIVLNHKKRTSKVAPVPNYHKKRTSKVAPVPNYHGCDNPMGLEQILHDAEYCGLSCDGTPDSWNDEAITRFARTIAAAELDGCATIAHSYVLAHFGFEAAEDMVHALNSRSPMYKNGKRPATNGSTPCR
jgi:hypothetical protein